MFLSSPEPDSADEYRGISDAFAAALHHTFIPGAIAAVILAIAGCVASVAVVRWVRRERARGREQRRALEERRRSEAAAASSERREFVRVPVRRSLSIPRSTAPGAPRTVFETQDVSAGGLSFNSGTPPPVGTQLELVLDLDLEEHGDLALQGEVVRVQPSTAPRGPALVGVAFRGTASVTRNALLRWIAAEEIREIAHQRREPLCSVCRRPLGETGASMHPTCTL